MFADYHVHSAYSMDSDYPMASVVRDAVEKGIDELCFTDHCDYGLLRDWDDPRGVAYRGWAHGEGQDIALANVDYPRYVEEIRALQQEYEGRLTIKLGMEFGMQSHTIADFERLFARYPFDFTLLSLHEIHDQELWLHEYQAGKTKREYTLGYYEEMLYLIEHFEHFSVLAHMDLITRYDHGDALPFEEAKPVLTKILETVIRNGKGIELNTSCHRYGLSDLTPSREILQLYHDLGGRILTLGSDSHKPEHLGAYIKDGREELKAMGFREFCTFTRMEPEFHPL